MSSEVQSALGRMEADDYERFKRDLRRREKHSRRLERITHAQWENADPQHPLGKGFPLGAPLRKDGESHRAWWMRTLRLDPCSFCGSLADGTVDHIVPQSTGGPGLHSWTNYTAACGNCNGKKGSTDLLTYLWVRNPPRKRRGTVLAA